jgi:hypothetical protein
MLICISLLVSSSGRTNHDELWNITSAIYLYSATDPGRSNTEYRHFAKLWTLYAIDMKYFKFIVISLLVLACNISKEPTELDPFNSKVKELFFGADVKSKYDDLVSYFVKNGSLKSVESGWTIYPPLSALREEKNSIDQKSFEFHDFLNLSSQLKIGTLNIRRLSPTKDALAILDVNLQFNTLVDAENFYNRLNTEFNQLPLISEESTFHHLRSNIIHDDQGDSVLKIDLFKDDTDKLFTITLRLVVGEA